MPQSTVLISRALAETQKVPFYLWKSLWNNHFDISDDLEPRRARERFLRGIVELWGKRPGQISAIEAAHVIGNLLGQEWPGSPFLEKYKDSALQRTEKAYVLIRELLGRISEIQPLVLAVEDLQWADKGSLDLLSALMKSGPGNFPILLIGSARREFLRENVHWSNLATVIRVEPLVLNSASVRQAYPALAEVPDSILDELSEKSGGNPYFLEEMVKSLTRADELTQSPSLQTLSELTEKMPGNLQAMLQARLDDLPRDVRDVALVASVVGRVFWEGAIVAAARQPVATGMLNLPENVLDRVVQNALRHLVRAELAFPRPGSTFSDEREYIFKNSLLRDVAYHLIPHKHLNYYHYAIARWLAERTGEDFAANVADHYERAGHFSRALRHFETAASYAAGNGATAEASELRDHIQQLRDGSVQQDQ